MNGIALNIVSLNNHLDFIREEIEKIRSMKKNLESRTEAKSDDASRLIRTYENIISELHYALQYSYDAETY